MPIYSYKCQKCSLIIEKLQSMKDEPLITCEKCGGKLKKQFGVPAVVYNCSGFHSTDYKK